MPNYRVLAADLLTGAIREEIPFSNLKYGRALNAPGSFSGTLALDHPKATRTLLDPGRTAIYVERDGVIVWGGILWTAQVQSRTVQFGAEGFWSYLRHRLIRADLNYVATDQLAIARAIVNYAQGISGGNLGIVVGAETCGVLRDRTYYGTDRKNVAEAVEELAAVKNGFDFAVLCAWSGSTISKTFQLNYPRRGTRTDLRFSVGVNVEDAGWQIDAARLANSVDVIGAGEGANMLIATAADTSAVGISYPLLEESASYKDVSEGATLQAHAESILQTSKRPVETIPTLLAYDASEALIGTWTEGDEVYVTADDGYLQLGAWWRIVSDSVSVSDEGRETVSLGFSSSDVFS